ncbi:hydroxyisourate hydrolase [Denitrobaculum tricleocarpae]|uniref:5-hydroxyisourate hydrolase n=1 Tax=Denitrobaculum tricleocarpae TaxID=2591009 RepID=A0A545SZ55_9PROT|nr:hydroxyisourate hydrolase [Denitrobaculum tricleocarpae]TQV70247.1 hydroxyisourate hydrolase [Denitrobaculum tricleocarpae]
MGRLTTHVLNTAEGVPGAGITLELYLESPDEAGAGRQLIKTVVTNDDGRCDSPLLEGEAFQKGTYELHFLAGDYFEARGVSSAAPRFLDRVVLRFGLADPDQHYHVPLLVSPYSYSTYRGS